jgi:hypothetical protein
MDQEVEHMSNNYNVFKPQYCTPHQKMSRDIFVLNRDGFSILTAAFDWMEWLKW